MLREKSCLLRTTDRPAPPAPTRRGANPPFTQAALRRRQIRSLLIQALATARGTLVLAVCALFLASGATLALWGLYLAKSALGIDLMPDRHLSDLLPIR